MVFEPLHHQRGYGTAALVTMRTLLEYFPPEIE
jgi:hypothetical protein